MSSPDLNRLLRFAAIGAMTLSLAACLRPLYGPTASGVSVPAALASIDVADVATPPAHERFGHYLRSELVFDLDGSGVPGEKRYKLALSYAQQIDAPIVDTTTGRAQSATLVGTVTYTLKSIADDKVVTGGAATATATYDRTVQRFATVRAERDAEIRLAKALAEQIKTRLAAGFATAS
jgi:LPS-assembly lipoprotein